MKTIVLCLGALAFFSVRAESRNYEIWRATIAIGAQTNVFVTTAPAYVWKIEVASGAPGSTFQIFGGTEAALKVTTSPAYDTSSSQNFYYPLSSHATGFMFTSVGASTVTAYWDYLYKSPSGQESVGLGGR